MSMRICFAVVLALFAASLAPAQSCLSAPMAGGITDDGVMFDLRVDGAQTVTVTDFSVIIDAPAGTAVPMTVYTVTAGGTYVGSETNSGAWTQVGTVNAVSAGSNVPTTLGLNLSIPLSPAQVLGFYVATDTSASIATTIGAGVGTTVVSNGELTLIEGTGIFGAFVFAFPDTIPNITVHHSIPGVNAEFEMNSPESSLVVGGAISNGCTVANHLTCTNGLLNLAYRTTLSNQPFELAISNRAAIGVSQGAIQSLTGLQSLNLDFSGFYWFLFGGSTFQFTPIAGNFNYDAPGSASPGYMTLQAYHASPSHPEGFDLSQAAQIETAAPGVLTLNLGDDAVQVVPLSSPNLCTGFSSFPFYGGTYTEVTVSSNGRIFFEGSSAAGTPSLNSALSGGAFVGAWADFDPSANGSISATMSNGQLRFDWTAVPPYNVTGQPDQTWAIILSPNDGSIVIEGVNTFNTVPGASMFLGVTPGSAGGATDAGAVNYTQTTGGVAAPTDMIYEFGGHGTLASGLTQLLFFPDGLNNYIWIAQ